MDDNLISLPYKKYCYYCGRNIFNKYIYICPVCNLSFCEDHKEPKNHECKGHQRNALPPGVAENDLEKMCRMCGKVNHPKECVYCGNLFCEEHIMPHDHYCSALAQSVLDDEIITLLKPNHVINEENQLSGIEKEKFLSLRGKFCYQCGKSLSNSPFFTCPVCGLSFCDEHKVQHKCRGYDSVKVLPPGIDFEDIDDICHFCGKISGVERCECGLQFYGEQLDKEEYSRQLNGQGYKRNGCEQEEYCDEPLPDENSSESNLEIKSNDCRPYNTEGLDIILPGPKKDDTGNMSNKKSDLNTDSCDNSESDSGSDEEGMASLIKNSILNITLLTVIIFILLLVVFYSFEAGVVELNTPVIEINGLDIPYVHKGNKISVVDTLITPKEQDESIKIQKLPDRTKGVYTALNVSLESPKSSLPQKEPENNVSEVYIFVYNYGHFSIYGMSGVKLSLGFCNENIFSENITVYSGLTDSGTILLDGNITLKNPLDTFIAEPGVTIREYFIPDLNLNEMSGNIVLSIEVENGHFSNQKEVKVLLNNSMEGI